MQRYFLNKPIIDTIKLKAGNDIFNHFGKVLRAKVGSKAEFVSDSLEIFVGEVVSVDSETININVINQYHSDVELPVQVTLVVSPLKNDRSDWFIQKATELGVNKIIFTSMKRTVVDWQKQQDKKLKRFKKIAQAAAEQAHRLIIPSIEFLTWQEMLLSPKHTGIVAWEESARDGETSMLIKAVSEVPSDEIFMVVFGPEGGLTETEVDKLQIHGFSLAGLGPRILRAETAPLYTMSAISVLRELR
ncbi:ribosomal RNA small subunit methyltransferase E [Leuconostoc litchii]|uniref:Ribosomal RNA small subunit methyltransferase E n=1 Tax=Leuconostoc litchii TaxID=1981069 RepID=A0A6P2CLJ9_9LACO|nr:RsmE family RNA methyltransferase [Leuconostoc litchii]TYC46918.1 16S rRNA (uracil(1498)-N(3))-methyltransferase [Leuconostoc litchii]GMA68821.1 ribosomal RNA small subunit methyltransferase E [Leuconostoc litchii]